MNLESFPLSVREMHVMEHLKNGLTYEDIASRLDISTETVRGHVNSIYRKLNVRNRAQALLASSNFVDILIDSLG